jgi:HK97 family phage prohead protease
MSRPQDLVNLCDWKQTAETGEASSTVLLRKQFVTEVEALEDRSIKFIITTGSADRENDVIDPSGWDVSNYLKNPVVLFAHDYGSLPVARTTELVQHGDKLIAIAEFASAELNPMAEQVFNMLKQGFLKGASVGFRPTSFEYNDERGGVDFTGQELLEFSVVPVPANAQALMAAGLDDIDTELLRQWATETLEAIGKGVSPKNVSEETAPMDTPWRRPTLGQFTEEPWEGLTNRKKRNISGHYAWATAAIPDTFGDMKLPHHRPDDGFVVWRGVVAASARLNQTNFPDGDLKKVQRHLAKHFEEFDRTAPWLRDAEAWLKFTERRDEFIKTRGNEPVSEEQLAELLADSGFEDEAITLMTSDEPTSESVVELVQKEITEDHMEDMDAFADGVRKQMNDIKFAVRAAIKHVDDFQNSYRGADAKYSPEKTEEESVVDRNSLEEGIVLELFESDAKKEQSDEVIAVDQTLLADAIRSGLSETVIELVNSETQKAVNAMRGRID